jgi:hypothetical protein
VSSTLLFADGNGFFAFDVNKTESALLEQLVVERKQFLEKPQRTIAIKYAQTLHDYVSAAEDAEVEPVLKELETVFESYPDNQVIKAYVASVGCMSARDKWFVLSKLSRVNSCIEAIDEAVRDSGNNPRVVAIRAGNSIKLPARFDRLPLAIEDINFLLSHGEPDKIGIANFRQRLLTQLVLLYGKLADAEKQQATMVKLSHSNPSPKLLQIAQAALL